MVPGRAAPGTRRDLVTCAAMRQLARVLSSTLLSATLIGGCGKKKSEPAATGSASAGNVLASLGKGNTEGGGEFTPTTKGFKFQNYGNDEAYENLSAAELQRMFGPGVCASGEGDTCILTPPGEQWRQEINKIMGGGHCEGMAVLSLLFQLGKADPTAFGAKSAIDLEIKDNKKLQREIAVWWATQVLIGPSRKRGTPVEMVDELTRALKVGDESYTLAFFKSDGTGGHATTPYAVVDKSDTETWIMHYDNNFPGQEKHIAIDRKANTWKYFTASNPKEPGESYDGDATTQTLLLGPTSARLKQYPCPFCGDIDPDAPADTAGTTGSRTILSEGDADLMITDDTGKRIGRAGGKVVNEIAGADVVQIASSALHPDPEPIYRIPNGHKLTVTLDGSSLKSKEPTDVSLVAPGYTLGVYGVALSPGEKDEIDFSADWKEVTYKTDKDETPELEIGIETAGADYAFVVNAGGETGGQRIDLSVDAKAGTFSVQATAKDGSATYEVEVHRIDKAGEQVFKHKGVASGGNDRFVFHYADWKGDGQPMKAGLDKGGDGSIDEDEELTDE